MTSAFPERAHVVLQLIWSMWLFGEDITSVYHTSIGERLQFIPSTASLILESLGPSGGGESALLTTFRDSGDPQRPYRCPFEPLIRY